jgi:hypothetical protein
VNRDTAVGWSRQGPEPLAIRSRAIAVPGDAARRAPRLGSAAEALRTTSAPKGNARGRFRARRQVLQSHHSRDRDRRCRGWVHPVYPFRAGRQRAPAIHSAALFPVSVAAVRIRCAIARTNRTIPKSSRSLRSRYCRIVALAVLLRYPFRAGSSVLSSSRSRVFGSSGVSGAEAFVSPRVSRGDRQ